MIFYRITILLMKCVFITGTLIKFEKAPFVVYIQPVGCTGALIDLQWVITAAHCFADQTKPPSVIFGTSDYRVFNYRVHSILVVNVNPKIKHFINITKSNNVVANSKNDLALIKLEKPVQLADGMEILVLDGKKWPKNKLEVECKIIAYGLTESSTKLTSKIVLTKYGKLCGCMHDEAILCAMPYNRSETPCFGDLGGVLVCNNEVVAICSQVVSKDYCKNNLKTSADYERNVCYNYERYPAVLSKQVQVLKLEETKWPNIENRKCKVAGYGHNIFDDKALREADVIVKHGTNSCGCMSNEGIICAKSFDSKTSHKVLNSPCHGDSGSVLVCNDKGVAVTSQALPISYCGILRRTQLFAAEDSVCGEPYDMK
uniref:Peptidase S1 domain-containing protein n=1 Tax=Rhodnius prolixus TaxID=13249 RepID=T1HKN5_RHOPR